jgi:prepilin-type N-terminal cleavage/methylation domain-containing protein
LRPGAGKKAYGRCKLLPLIPGGGLLRRYAPRNDRRHQRAGFTLVEVIVVLVILAILAAIAIPALTGYIDKAQDKQYIAEARNTSVAVKTVLSEAYGAGEITDNIYSGSTSSWNLFTVGTECGDNAVKFYISQIFRGMNGDKSDEYKKRVNALGSDTLGYTPVALRGSGATAATADGFKLEIYPEGAEYGKPMIIVTYKLARDAKLDSYGKYDDDSMNDFLGYGSSQGTAHYDPNAGYEVYRLIYNND